MREMLSGAARVGPPMPGLARAWPSSIWARSVTRIRRILRRGLPRAARAEWRPYIQKLLLEACPGSFFAPLMGPVLRFFVATLGCSICSWGPVHSHRRCAVTSCQLSIDRAPQFTNMRPPQFSSGAIPLCRRAILSLASGSWRYLRRMHAAILDGSWRHSLASHGGVSRAAKGADCQSAGAAFVGSSPTSPTNRKTMSGNKSEIGTGVVRQMRHRFGHRILTAGFQYSISDAGVAQW